MTKKCYKQKQILRAFWERVVNIVFLSKRITSLLHASQVCFWATDVCLSDYVMYINKNKPQQTEYCSESRVKY